MTRGKRWTEPLRTLVACTGDVLYNSTRTPMNQAPLSISNVTSPPSSEMFVLQLRPDKHILGALPDLAFGTVRLKSPANMMQHSSSSHGCPRPLPSDKYI